MSTHPIRTLTRLFVTLSAAGLLAACGPASPPEQAVDGGPVLAKVDGQAIHADELALSLTLMPEPARIALLNDKEALRRYVEEYAHKEMIYREALKQGMDKDPQVRRQVALAEKSIITQRMLEKVIADQTKVTDADIRKYFDEHKDEFTTEERWTLAHIQFATLKDAQAAAQRLARGEDFAQLALELSTDTMSKHKGGQLGTVERSKAPPEFAQVLAGMKKGEVSPPIKTQHGYHLVKLVDVQPGGLMAFEGVREPLRQFLAQEKQRQALEAYIQSLKKEHKVELQPSEIDRFVQANAIPKK
ncbi:MAG: peptidyl-prolyl cis-trans isomerase [Burkholderiales bacterium]|nr:peptidyl-prolyl cis-trans isomerase [Burkholderiales bacterium]